MSQKNKKVPSRSILKSLTYGSGAFLFDSFNAFTPHGSGAVDIMAVRQKDGQIKSSPFYVRFGKYQSFRRNRQVRVKVNGVLMDFHLELGQYGSAFFAHTRDEEVLSDGDHAAGDDDDHSLGMMSPVAAYEADYMSLVQASDQTPPPQSAARAAPRRSFSTNGSAAPAAAASASPPVHLDSPPVCDSLPMAPHRGAAGSRVMRCASGPAGAPGALLSDIAASPPALAAPTDSGTQHGRDGPRCGHDWRDLDRSCTPRGDADAVATGASQAAARSVGGWRAEVARPVPPPEIACRESLGSCSGEIRAEDVPDSAAALQNAAERAARGMDDASVPDLPPVLRPSMDAVHRQLGFEARRSTAPAAVQAAGNEGTPVERGLVVRLQVDLAEAPDVQQYVRVMIFPWTRNVSLISAAGLTSIHTSLDRTTSAGKAALTGDPSIDFAAAAAAHASGAAPMASIAGRATAASTQERTASEDPSNATDESSLDDSSDEDDATSRPRQPVAAGADVGGAGEVATGVPSRPQHGRHERHASFQAWAGSYAGPPSRGTDDDDGDIVMASSPHAECMQIGAGAMHDEEVRKSMEAARLVEALEATGLQEGGVTAAEGVGGAGGLLEGGELEGEGGVRGSSGGGAAPQGEAGPEIAIAACAHLLSPDVPPSAVAAAFEQNRLPAADVAERGLAALQPERLAVRIDGFVYRYADAAPLLLALQVFGGTLKQWQKLVPTESYECPKPQSTDKQMKRRRTWWASMFWGASSRDATRATAGALPRNPSATAAAAAAGLTGDDSLDLEEAAAAEAADRGSSAAASLQGADSLQSSSKARQPPRVKRVRHVKVQSTHPTSEQLQAMAEHLQLGQNTVEFSVGGQRVQSFIHLFDWNIRLIISDIDGTITRSDVLGHVLTPLGVDWTHPGVTRLFSNAAANGYQFVYLSSRSIAQSGITRAFLETLRQQDHGLPAGPVIISPHGIIPSLYREMILKRPEEFKMAALQGIRSLFPDDWNPFYCGFGNRGSDDISYLHVGVPPHRIFTINPAGRVRQLSEPAGSGRFNSLNKIDDHLDLLFPVTETARRRLFAAQASGSARNTAAAAAVAAASAAAAASLTPALQSAAAAEPSDVDPEAAAAAAAADVVVAAAAPRPDGAAAAGSRPPPSLLATQLVPMESAEAAVLAPRLTREGSDHSFDAQVDVDARDEFNDNNFWKAGISMDSTAAAELEDLLAGGC